MKRLFSLATPLLLLAAFSACGSGKPPVDPTPAPSVTVAPTQSPTEAPTSPPATSPIQHIIVVVQENRTQDNLFHGYPDGATFPGPADTVQSGLNSHGQTVQLVPQSLAAPCGPSHSHPNFVTEYDNGKMDGFDLGNCKEPGGTVYAYVPMNEVASDWFIASHYGMANHVAQLNQGPSFPAHQYLIAGQAGGRDNVTGDPTNSPYAFSENGGVHDNGTGSNGHTSCGVPAQDTVVQIDLTSGFPGVEGHQAYPCYDVTTIFDGVAAKGLTWRYYGNKPGGLWGGTQSIRHLFNSPNYVVGGPHIFDDIAAGKLANLSYVMPAAQFSDHPSRHYKVATDGPNWIGDVINAVGQSPYWNSTAIVVTWDDWGGFYDHHKPALASVSNSYGMRVPLLVASPYSIPGAVDTTETSQAAILNLIEHSFGLPSLHTADADTSDDLTSLFNFGAPARPFVAIPTTEPPSYFKCKHCNDDSTGPDDGIDG